MNTASENSVDRESEEFRTAVERLYFWSRGGQSNFTSMLYDLFAKADRENFELLRRGFPSEAHAFELWKQSTGETTFFREHGFILP